VKVDELDSQLEELEVRLERLRALYEQYFLGFEKIMPAVARKDVDRRIWTLRHEHIRNTARRFKLQTLVQRYNTYQQYWQRICREIEQGTYKRHLVRAERITKSSDLLTIAARRRAGAFRKAVGDEAMSDSVPPESQAPPASELPEAAASSVPAPPTTAERPKRPLFDELELDGFLGHALAQPDQPKAPAASGNGTRARPPPPPRPLRPRAEVSPAPLEDSPKRDNPVSGVAARPALERKAAKPAKSPAGAPLSDERLRELHAQLIDRKVQNNERGNVSLDKLAKSLRDAESQLREKHGSRRRIDFDVIVKNGKVVLKPIVR
jgi:hypothetical protein